MKKKYDEYKITVESPMHFQEFVKSSQTAELKNLYKNKSPWKGDILIKQWKKSTRKVDKAILNLINDSMES